jgi:hypothetical protein
MKLTQGKKARTLTIYLDNSGNDASLERWKIYVATPDPRAESVGQIRIDESRADYLYPGTTSSLLIFHHQRGKRCLRLSTANGCAAPAGYKR